MKKLFVVDAVNLLFRSYYAIQPLSNSKGESTNALFGFIRSINKIIEDFSPDYLIAVFDGKDNKKSRTAIYADYKIHRAKMPDDLFPQLEKAHHWCQIFGIPLLSLEGVEADDTMGSIAVWASHNGMEVYLCSSDKDLCQLITDHVFVLNVHKNNLLIDKNKVQEIYGISPDQMIDYLAIVGDDSDNIPGLEGFGPKTASSLLQEWKNLDRILENFDKIPGQKKQDILKRDREIALLSRRLATIDIHVNFPQEEAFFEKKQLDLEILREFYREMNFLSLLKDLENHKESIENKNLLETSYNLVNDSDFLEMFHQMIKYNPEICIDTETTHIHPMQAEIVGIGFSIKSGESWYIPFNGNLSRLQLITVLTDILKDPQLKFYGHNIKYDLHILRNEGLPYPSICFDTILASYLINPHSHRHNLDQLCLEFFQKTKTPIEELIGKGKQQISLKEVPIERVCNYCCEDTDYTTRLKVLFEKQLQDLELTSVLTTIELPLLSILCSMERRGIYLDLNELKNLSFELIEEIKVIKEQIYAMAGEQFNLNSTQQLSRILFEKMGIQPPKKNQKGFSTNAQVLTELQDQSPIIQKILDYRSLEKLRSTYIDSLPLDIHPKTHRIHCTFNQSVAATGRLSCQNPNLQNIPVRSNLGNKIRRAFKPQDPDWSFLSADYSQIELRLLAHLSEDPTLLKAFNEGEDIHTHTASVVFGIPIDQVSAEMRYKAKAVNFGILYGQQAFGLSQGLKISFKEASIFIKTYFERYKKVKDFLEFCKESARKTGRVVTLTGRHRPIPDINSSNLFLRNAAERLAINTPLQGTAADLIKIAMIQIDTLFKKESQLAFMLLQIHDELIFESHDSSISSLSLQVKKIMENVVSLKVPLIVNISIGKNWGEC